MDTDCHGFFENTPHTVQRNAPPTMDLLEFARIAGALHGWGRKEVLLGLLAHSTDGRASNVKHASLLAQSASGARIEGCPRPPEN